MAKVRVFRGTSTANLQIIHDRLVALIATGGMGSGMQSYVIAGRSVQRMNLIEMMDLLNEVSNELALRGLPTQDGLYLAEFGETS